MVVFVAMIPASPNSSATSTTSSISLSAISGEILTKIGSRNGVAFGGQTLPFLHQRSEQRRKLVALLPLPQTGRVGRRDVHHDEIRQARQPAESVPVVVENGVVAGDQFGLADIDAQRHRQGADAAQLRQPFRHDLRPIAVETQSIDDRAELRNPKDTWARIARLRLRRHRTDFHRPETEPGPDRDRLAVLVTTGCQTDRIGKVSVLRRSSPDAYA